MTPPTREECESDLLRHVDECKRALGLAAWGSRVRFVSKGDLSEDARADVEINDEHQSFTVRLDERTRPKHYRLQACHEVLHVVFKAPWDVVTSDDTPPGKVVGYLLHASIDRVALAMCGYESGPYDSEMLLTRPPWEG